jgi:hypothetical protein
MIMIMRCSSCLLIGLLATTSAAVVKGQVLYGGLVASVTDQIGGVLAGATVTITTSGASVYSFSDVPPGAYKLRIGARCRVTARFSF